MTAAMADWGGLYYDLLVLILKNINLIEDFAAFGMVCKSWHAVAATNKQYLRRHPQSPWLMLPAREAKAERQIFSLSKQDTLRKNLYIPEMSDKNCIGLNYGWVLTAGQDLTAGLELDMHLLHPLSRYQIQLPPRSANLRAYLRKGALSANPSESPSDFVLMIVYSLLEDILAYWRPGDKKWTKAGAAAGFSDLTYHDDEDRFYAITHIGAVWSWKDLGPAAVQDPILAREVAKMYWGSIRDERSTAACLAGLHVVPGSAPGSVFVLVCFRDEFEFIADTRELMDGWEAQHFKMWFRVYELDLRNGNGGGSEIEIKSFGDRAIFFGRNTSVALQNASEYPGVKPNHIYFTNDIPFRWEKEVGWYNLEDGETTHFRVDVSLGWPFWFMPSF